MPPTLAILPQDVGVRLHEKSGAVVVDELSRTTCPSIWAIGDVTDRVNLTPVALMEGRALAKTLFGGQPTKPDYDNVSCCPEMLPKCPVPARGRCRFLACVGAAY